MFWLVLVVVALVFVAAGTRRYTVPIGAIDVVQANGRTLTFGISACEQRPRTTVEETATTVRIQVTVRRAYCSGAECADTVTVTLDQPLGERQLIDASTGTDVPVEESPT